MAFKYVPHPDDEEMLLRIRRYLIGFRVTNGWTQEQLSRRISNTTHAVWGLEKGGFDWGLQRLQNWVYAFDLRLKAVPLFFDLTYEACIEVDQDQAVSSTQAAMEESDDWRSWQRLYLTAYLKAAREAQDITRAELGARMGITAGAVSAWEINAVNVRLLRLLNHARALGGRIELSLS